MTEILLGINNCFAVKRWPEPEGWVNIVAVELDLKYVQYSFDLLDPRTSRGALAEVIHETLDSCREYGVVIDTTFTGLAAYSFNLLMHPNPAMRADAIDWYEHAIEASAMMGVRGTGGHVASLSWVDYQNEGRRRYLEECLIESLQYLSSLASEKRHEFFLWEPMPVVREPPCTINDAKKLLAKVNERAKVPIKLCIDTGHQCAWKVESSKDLDVYAWIKELGSDSPIMHIQQNDGKGDRHWPFTEEYNKVGVVKADKVIKAIDESGAKRVLLALEIIHPFEAYEPQVVKDLKESVQYWRQFL